MIFDQPPPAGGPGSSPAECLERGEILYYPACPFALPQGGDHQFLLDQQLGRGSKNISYAPDADKAGGFRRHDPAQTEHLRSLFADFSRSATAWLAHLLPGYASGWQLDRVSYRPEEEATRKLRQTARNDLLHVDAFPSRPTGGHRILRLFVNINRSDPRVWVTSEPFSKLLERYGARAGLPNRHRPPWKARLREGMIGLFRPNRVRRSVYDDFMLRFHHYLKANDDFQEHTPKRYWHFQPGSSWLVMTDAASHAALRGRYALEHSYFIAPESLALPDESPAALLEKACGSPVLRRAA